MGGYLVHRSLDSSSTDGHCFGSQGGKLNHDVAMYCLMSTNIAVSHFVNQVPRTENPKLIFEDLGSDVRNKKIFGCSKIVNSEFS